jgi:hypothetical protein
MEMSRAKRIRILKDLQKTLMSIQCITYSDQPQALSDSIAEAELMEKVAEGMPEKKDVESKTILQDIREGDYDYGFNAALELCQAYRVSRVGEIEKISFQVLTELEPVC